MPDLWMDVDAALTEVPINKVQLIDDTDFKTREESVTFDQAGLDLVWNFTTTAGVFTQTAVTPTDTAGDYDFVNQGNAFYTLEIPASGGASINNDTEGFGYFAGFATGILPWIGPTIGFRAAGLNNALIDSAYSATRGLTGTAVPDAAADGAGGLATSAGGATGIDDLALASSIAALNDVAATDIVTAGAITTSSGAVVSVTTVATTTTNSDMRGTDNALLAVNVPTNFVDLAITATTGMVTVGTNNDKTGYDLNADQSGVTIGVLSGQTPQTGDSYLLLTGAQAEPTGVPAVNETPMVKLGYMFAALRNKVTTTATKKQFFDDADAAMWEKDLSDDGSTYTETEANVP